MDKLQQLSTGLKVQSNEMQPAIIKKDDIFHSEKYMNRYPDLEKYEFPGGLECIVTQNDNEGDYYKVLKEKLLSGTVKESSSILQSLRLTLIHTLAKERATLMNSYIQNDILNLNKDPLITEHLLPKEIVNGWDLILQQMILKFINTLCSMWKGRDYLTSNTKIITSLVNYFYQKYAIKSFSNAISQDMLVAILHKLCTRQNQQIIVLNSGAVEKIFYNICEEHNSISTYRLRHSLGVLINVCVYNSGRNILEPMNYEVINFLKMLIERHDKKVVPHIARLIYVLMANEKFHKKAKEVDLLNSLEKAVDVSNKRLKLQLDVLRTVIENQTPHEYLYGTEENFLSNIEAEIDELEEEVEINEPSITSSDTETGKNFKANFELSDEKPIKVKNDKNTQYKKSQNIGNAKKSTRSSLPKPVKSENKNKSGGPKQITKTTSNPNNFQTKLPKSTVKSKSMDRIKDVNKLNVTNTDDNVTYIILNDSFNNPITTTNKSIEKQSKYSVSAKNSDDSTSSCENVSNDKKCILNDNSNIAMDNNTSFLVLSENESNKSTSIDLNPYSTSESIHSVEQIDLPSDIVKTSEMLDKIDKNLENSQYLINNDETNFVSLFIQQGKITEIEYDYCEETKEIQSPIKFDNIFNENRQSPYRNLLTESQKYNNKQNDLLQNKIELEPNKDESETSTENSDNKANM